MSLLEWLPIALSLVSVVLTGLFALQSTRLSHRMSVEREERLAAQSALKAAERVYEPLAQSAAELQSRIFNIVESGWVGLMKRYESHGDYALVSTAFLFAHYFGWIEARRQAVLSSSGEGGRDIAVQKLIDDVLKTLRRSEDSEGFLFFTVEQRAIGELMLDPDDGRVMGYATFAERYRSDRAFREWFAPVEKGMALVSKGDNRRLIDIQRALVALIDTLDPKRRYTAGYDLQVIDPA